MTERLPIRAVGRFIVRRSDEVGATYKSIVATFQLAGIGLARATLTKFRRGEQIPDRPQTEVLEVALQVEPGVIQRLIDRPPCTNVAEPANFVGKRALLDDIRSAYRMHYLACSDDAAARPLVDVLWGRIGVGKTAVARKYASNHLHEQGGVVWLVDAQNEETIRRDMAKLAEELLGDKFREHQMAVRPVLDALAQQDVWLLIFDDAVTAQDIEPFIPEGSGHVIVTTRNCHQDHWRRSGYRAFELPLLSDEETVELLLGQAATADDLEFEPALALARQIDANTRDPQRLIFAHEFMEDNQIGCEEFRRRLTDAGDPIYLAGSWGSRFADLEAQDPKAAELLRVVCFYGSGDFPRRAAAAACGEGRAGPVIDALVRTGWAGEGVQAWRSLNVATGVQGWMIDELERSGGAGSRAAAAISALGAVFPNDVHREELWEVCDSLASASRAVLGHAAYPEVDGVVAARLAWRLGVYLHLRGNARAATELLELALSKCGTESEQAIGIRTDLGRALHRVGRLAEAKRHLQHALAQARAQDGYSPVNVLGALGGVYEASATSRGDWEIAIEYLEEALALLDGSDRANGRTKADILHTVGRLYARLGRWTEAKRHVEDALVLDRRHAGNEMKSPHQADREADLAQYYHDIGDFTAAEAHYQAALRIGSDGSRTRPDEALDLCGLGHIEGHLGHPYRALETLKRAETKARPLGENAPEYIRTLIALGRAQHQVGEFQEAAKTIRRAMTLLEDLGAKEDNPVYAAARDALADVYHDLGRYQDAKELYRDSLRFDGSFFGVQHPDRTLRERRFAHLWRHLGDLAEAQQHLESALENHDQIFGCRDHPERILLLIDLATLLRVKGRPDELAMAETHLNEAMAMASSVYGRYEVAVHPDKAIILAGLALVKCAQGDFASARPHAKAAWDIDRGVYGAEHPRTALRQKILGRALIGLLRPKLRGADAYRLYSEAKDRLESALEINARCFELDPEVRIKLSRGQRVTVDHPETAAVLVLLGELLAIRGELPLAQSRIDLGLDAVERKWGANHFEVALVLESRAAVKRLAGDCDGAIDDLERAKKIVEQAAGFGPKHPLTQRLSELIERVRDEPVSGD